MVLPASSSGSWAQVNDWVLEERESLSVRGTLKIKPEINEEVDSPIKELQCLAQLLSFCWDGEAIAVVWMICQNRQKLHNMPRREL